MTRPSVLRRRVFKICSHQPLGGGGGGTDCLHFRLEDEGSKFLRQPCTGLNAVVVRKLGTNAVKSADSCGFIDAQCNTELMSYKLTA